MNQLNDKIKSLPTQPGCYLFKDESEVVIYVGKAKNLKKRVSNYFQKKDHDPKTLLLVSKIAGLDFLVTRTEVEALILENNLIKKYYPRFNIDLKDSRRYAYLKFHNSEYPWIEVVRKREGEGEYYGPFVSGQMRRHVIEILRKYFGIFLKKPKERVRNLISKEDYAIKVKQAKKIIAGKSEEVISELEKEMKKSSEIGFYEHAITRRDQIKALESLKERQIMELKRSVDAHIINYIINDQKVYLLVFNIRKGILEGKQKFIFDYRQGIIEEFITQFYSITQVPQEIILPSEIDSSIKNYLQQLRKSSLEIIVPTRGEKKNLLDLVRKNVEATFFSGLESIMDLKQLLNLRSLPKHIECFDISHLAGTSTVASMVTFIEGKPDKTKYRRFKIQTPTNSDDFAAMHEVVLRRYSKTLKETMGNPDLIVIDGGIGQLNTAIQVLKSLNLKIEIISLAKRLEEVYKPETSEPISLPRKSKGLLLLRAIRDEAHRFAITYNRLLRTKSALGNDLNSRVNK